MSSMYLGAVKLDLDDGPNQVIVLHELDAQNKGINVGDIVNVSLFDNPGAEVRKYNMTVQITNSLVKPGQVGIFADDWESKSFKASEAVRVRLQDVSPSVQYIREKIKGEALSYEKMYSIVKDIANHRLSQVLATYFLSTFYTKGFTEDEIYYLTKAMAETGEMLKFGDRIVADKHSIGGVGGKGVTPIVVSIAMAEGLLVPNTSTKAITTSSATADMLEAIMPVSFNKSQLETLVEQVGGFLIWGGALDLAPADDVMIQVEKPLHLESYDKFSASIIAKKIAQGVNHLVIDMPKGPGTKVRSEKDVNIVRQKFFSLAKKFGIKIAIYSRDVDGIDGNAVGPALEAREFIYVLEQNPIRSMQLENISLDMAGLLFELTGTSLKGHGRLKAEKILQSGQAFEKFKEIYKAQGGKEEDLSASAVCVGEHTFDIIADSNFTIAYQDNKEIFKICRALGNPYSKCSGVYFYVRKGAVVEKGDRLATLYAESAERLELAKSVWGKVAVFGKEGEKKVVEN
jgi:AMP phosphorylase